MGRRLTADRQLADPNAEVMSGDERAFLRRRILEGLHVVRLRVPEAVRPPHERLMASSRPVTSELLRELERLHRAALVPELAIAAGAGAQLWDVECTKTLDVPTDLPRGPYIVLRVAGESMEPLIHSGDLVLVRVDEKAAPDTVVVARDPEHGYVVKQVGRITALGIELRSLNPAFPTLHVPHSTGSVLGTVVLRWREAGTGQ
jgi:SOS-response transcriptional repressor LexA